MAAADTDMLMPALSDSARQHIATTLAATPHGERRRTAGRLADLYGVSISTIYRAAGLGGAARPRPPREDYREWVKTAVTLAHRAPAEPVSLDLAIEVGIKTGELPPEAAAMPLASAYRIRRELGLHRGDARTQRMGADYPMQAVQFDGSTSMYISVVEQLDEADWQLRLYRRPIPARGYKNKPLGPHRERLVTYGLWDMCTGYCQSCYTVAVGENALDAVTALVGFLGEDKDPRLVMHGVPDDLWLDQGPITKSIITTDLLARLGINLVTGKPYEKTRMGGVERTWRSMWQRFERSLFLLGQDEFTLAALNAWLVEYLVRENALRSARTPVGGRTVSRTAAWAPLTHARQKDRPLRRLPDQALATLAAQARRKLDMNGILRWEGKEYEVLGLHNCWVMARRAVDGSDSVVVECEATGRRVTAMPFEPRPYGRVVAAEKLPLHRLLATQSDTHPGADIYAPRLPVPTNVQALPTRRAPAAALDNPLAAGHYADLDSAMQAFCALYPYPLTEAGYTAVRVELAAGALSAARIAALANELITQAGGSSL